jgi:hypothetical protein
VPVLLPDPVLLPEPRLLLVLMSVPVPGLLLVLVPVLVLLVAVSVRCARHGIHRRRLLPRWHETLPIRQNT